MPSSSSPTELRAAPSAIPPATHQQLREQAKQDAYQRDREQVERRHQLRGLLLLAVIVLIFSILRFGPDRIFTTGWWRLW